MLFFVFTGRVYRHKFAFSGKLKLVYLRGRQTTCLFDPSKKAGIVAMSGIRSRVMLSFLTTCMIAYTLFVFFAGRPGEAALPMVVSICCFTFAAALLMTGNNPRLRQSAALFLCMAAPLPVAVLSAGPPAIHLSAAVLASLATMGLFHFLTDYFRSQGLTILPMRWLMSVYFTGTIAAVIAVLTRSALPVKSFIVGVGLLLLCALARLYFSVRKTTFILPLRVLAAGGLPATVPVAAYLLHDAPGVRGWMLPLALLLSVTVYGFAARDGVIDLPYLCFRLLYYGLIGAFSTVLVAMGLLGMAGFSGSVDDRQDLIRLVAMVMVAVTAMLFVKSHFDYYLRKRLFLKRRDFQTSLNRFLQWMKASDDPLNSGEILKKETEACLPVEEVSLMTKPRERLAGRRPGLLKTNSVGFSVLLSLRKEKGAVLTGKWKQPRRRLNPDERVWFANLIGYAQILAENLFNTKDLLAELRQSEGRAAIPITIKRTMLRLSERERWRLSRNLHDQTMQDQLAIAREIDIWQAKEKNPEVRRVLTTIRERILDSVYVLRQVIHDIHPEFLYKTGLKKSLNELIEKVNLRADFLLDVTIDDTLVIPQKDLEMVVYRVVQELLNNAVKHAKARHVHLVLRQQSSDYVLVYQDDGVGMNVAGVRRSFGTMGLPGLIGRVEGMGGRMQLRSGKGGGLYVAIHWPKRTSFHFSI